MEELKSTSIVISSKVRTCLHFSHRRDQVGRLNFPSDFIKMVRDSFPVLFRRKFHIQVTELEKKTSTLISKCSGLEMSTSRLQSEVDVLIIDFEKVIYQNTKEKRSIYFIIETY